MRRHLGKPGLWKDKKKKALIGRRVFFVWAYAESTRLTFCMT